MTKIYNKSEGHKKVLVPVIALLLCATALIGAGYAALAASTATSSGNGLDGEVIILDLGEVDDYGKWITSITADTKFTYFSQSEEGNIKYYVGTDDVKIGTGTLKIDGTDYTGNNIKINKAVKMSLGDNNSLENQVSVYVKFTPDAINAGIDSDDGIDIDGESKVFDFEIFIKFNGTDGTVTQANADGKVETEDVIFLDDDTEIEDLINGFTYDLIFSAYIIE